MSAVREELKQWMQLVRSDSHVLRDRPSLLFQQAANLPDDSAPSRAARRRIENGIESRPWIRLINKSRGGSPLQVTLRGHSRAVRCCAISPDGSRVASGSADETLRLWDSVSGADLGVLVRGEGEVIGCAFSPDGLYIAASLRIVDGNRYRHRTIRIWDSRSQRVVRDLDSEGEEGGIVALAFLPRGRLLAAYYAGPLRVWDLESGSLVQVVDAGDAEERGIADLHVSAAGDRLATVHGAALAGGTYGMNVKVRDAGSFELLAQFQHASTGRPKACAFTPAGDRLITVGQGVLRAWDAATWREIFSVDDRMGLWLTESCTVVGDSIVTVRNQRDVAVFDAATGEHRAGWAGHADTISCCEPFPGGSRVVTGSQDHTLRVWELQGAAPAGRAHDATITHVTFSADGTRVASAAADETVKIWETSTGELKGELKIEGKKRAGRIIRPKGVVFCCFSPDGSRLAIWADYDPSHRVTDIASGVDLATTSRDVWGTRGTFTSDGRGVLTLAPDAELWEYESGAVRTLFRDAIDDWTRHGMLQSSDHVPGGALVAAAFYGRGLHVFDFRTNRIRSYPDLQSDWQVCACSPDDETILYGAARIGAHLVSLSGDRVTPLPILEETRRFKRCVFSPDGSKVLTVIGKRHSEWENGVEVTSELPEAVFLWSVPDFKLEAEIVGPVETVDCGFSPDGDHVVLLESSRVRILDARNLRDRAVMWSHLGLSNLALSSSGVNVAAGSGTGDLLLLSLENLATPIINPL